MDPSSEQVVAGSYERFLFGFQCSTSGSDAVGEVPALRRNFTYPAHKGPVKCLAAAAPFVASGGGDDLIHVYDLQSGSDLGCMMNPGEGAVSAIAFYSHPGSPPSHLLSGSADGSLTFWQAGGEWACLKNVKGHRPASCPLHPDRREVNSISLHPSGRLALSASRDSTIKLWNLVRGKCAHTMAVSAVPEQAAFSPSGLMYAFIQSQKVLLRGISSSEAETCYDHPHRPQCLAFGTESVLQTGSEDGSIHVWDARAGNSPVALLSKAHGIRVRAVAPFGEVSQCGDGSLGLTASASTDGVIKIWDFRRLSSTKPVAEAETKARLTCLSTFRMDASSRTPTAEKFVSANKAAVVSPPSTKSSGEGMSMKPGAEDRRQPKKRKGNVRSPKPQPHITGEAYDGVVEYCEGRLRPKIQKPKEKRLEPSSRLPSKGGAAPSSEKLRGKRK